MEEQNLLVSERIERGTNRLREAQRVAIESEGEILIVLKCFVYWLFSRNWGRYFDEFGP